MIKGRVIAIGAVHGCIDELRDLLDTLAPAADDYVLFLGDLVNRGPDSHAVIQTAREIGARALLGNHELRLLQYRKTGDKSRLRPNDFDTIRQLTDADWRYLENMALHHHRPDLDTVFVHGGFIPGRDWRTQPAEVVTRIQVLGPDNKPLRRGEAPYAPIWADLWRGPPFVVFGHTPFIEAYRAPAALGIDTGCVMGGKLTAFVLPERRLVQVKARRRYA